MSPEINPSPVGLSVPVSLPHLRLPADTVRISWETEAPTWQRSANCLGVDPDLFFPGKGGSSSEAKEVCRGCVVRQECLQYAIDNKEKFGVWGGKTERERRRFIDRRPYRKQEKRLGSIAVSE